MKTPMQEFEERFFAVSRISNYQSSDGRQDEVVDLEVLTNLFAEMLEKEEEVMCNFTADYTTLWEFQPLCGEVISIQDYYNETFNTKER